MRVTIPNYERVRKHNRAQFYLCDPRTAPETVWHSFHAVLGPNVATWLPETIRAFSAKSHTGFEFAQENFDKFFAVRDLLYRQTCMWEMHAFENTVRAFNGLSVDADSMQECDAKHMAWAVNCMWELLQNTESGSYLPRDVKTASQFAQYFHYEVIEYVATSLFRDGIIIAPTPLEFAQEHLDALYRGNGNESLQAKTRAALSKNERGALPTDEEVAAQLEPIEEAAAYCAALSRRQSDELRFFT